MGTAPNRAQLATSLIGAAILLFLPAAIAQTHAAAIELRILQNGHVRIDNGPEIDLRQLKLELQRISKERTAPRVHLLSNKDVSYAVVSQVLREFQETNCCDLGFVGNEQFKQ